MSESDRLNYFVGDITALGTTFDRESRAYVSGMPMDGAKCPFGCPRAGDALTDRMLETALRMIGEVHLQIGQAMANHGKKLGQAAQRYENAEARNNAIIWDVLREAEIAPLPPDQHHP